ncbi:MAG: YceH family protein [Planctomycetes bacterium]|nr:YceH family protein [Planctomycetota bacterium]
MPPTLDPTERRIIGVLLEKALTTPEYYPLTVNALVAACNQKSNRDPVTAYEEYEIEGALRSLLDKRWVARPEAQGRVARWRHCVDERLGLVPVEQAVLAELLLRGAQQPGELRARASRMAELPTQEALTTILDRLASRTPPLVERRPRVSGERADRYGQTLASDGAPPAAAAEPERGPASPALPSPVAVPSATTVAPGTAPVPALTDRVATLEREVAVLKAALESLRTRTT